MTETVTLELLFALTQRVHDELRDMRNEMRRLAENQVSTARAVETSRDNTESCLLYTSDAADEL